MPFATVSVSKEGAKKPDYYDLSTENGEVLNNTLGRYVILSLTYRFGTFDRSKMRGPR